MLVNTTLLLSLYKSFQRMFTPLRIYVTISPCLVPHLALWRKINDKNDQESTICNVCGGEIHNGVSGWVDYLFPDSRLINYEEENSRINQHWWVSSSSGSGGRGYALWRWHCDYISWPWCCVWFMMLMQDIWYVLKRLVLIFFPSFIHSKLVSFCTSHTQVQLHARFTLQSLKTPLPVV